MRALVMAVHLSVLKCRMQVVVTYFDGTKFICLFDKKSGSTIFVLGMLFHWHIFDSNSNFHFRKLHSKVSALGILGQLTSTSRRS